jgi:hypothetical protein
MGTPSVGVSATRVSGSANDLDTVDRINPLADAGGTDSILQQPFIGQLKTIAREC